MVPENRPEDTDLWGCKAEGKPEDSRAGQNDRNRRADTRDRESLQEVYHLISTWFRRKLSKTQYMKISQDLCCKFPNRKDKTSSQHNTNMIKCYIKSARHFWDNERSWVLPQKGWNPRQKTNSEAIIQPLQKVDVVADLVSRSRWRVLYFSIHNISKFHHCTYLATYLGHEFLKKKSHLGMYSIL